MASHAEASGAHWSRSLRFMKTRFPYAHHKSETSVLSNVGNYFADSWPSNDPMEKDHFRLLMQDCAKCTTMTLPAAMDERIEIATMLTLVGFLLDDAIDDHWNSAQKKEFFIRFPGLVLGIVSPTQDNQYEFVVAYVYSRIRATDLPGQPLLGLQFFNEHIRLIMASINQKDRNRASDEDNLQSYFDYRWIDAGIWWGFALLRWAYNLQVPQYMLEHPDVHSIHTIAGSHGILVNDLFSHHKEATALKKHLKADTQSCTSISAIPAVMKEHNLQEEDAVRYIKDRIHYLEEELIETEARLQVTYTGEDRKICGKYVTAIKYLYGGNLEWSRDCIRYNSL